MQFQRSSTGGFNDAQDAVLSPAVSRIEGNIQFPMALRQTLSRAGRQEAAELSPRFQRRDDSKRKNDCR